MKASSLLIVDDQAAVRKLVGLVARTLGFSSLEAQNGWEALQVLASHHSEIAMVIIDVDMPVMDGIESARRMKGLDPKMPIILMSGRFPDLTQFHGCRFVSKPFEIAELADAIRQTVAAATARPVPLRQ